MKKSEVISKKEIGKNIVHLHEIFGKRVIANNGQVLGRVKDVILHSRKLSLEAVHVKRGAKPILVIGKNYIDKTTDDAVILSIYPSILIKGRRVIDGNGDPIATIHNVVRKGNSNDIEELEVYSLWKGKFKIPSKYIKSIGERIVLKNNYHAPKKYFWQKSQ